MATWCVLAMPGTGPGGANGVPPHSRPSQVHLKGGGVAKPNAAGYILVESSDSASLIANGWILLISGDDEFMNGLAGSTNASGKPLWIAGPNNSFDGSNGWLPSEES